MEQGLLDNILYIITNQLRLSARIHIDKALLRVFTSL